MAVASAGSILWRNWLGRLFDIVEIVEYALSKSSRARLYLVLLEVLCIHLLTTKGADVVVSIEKNRLKSTYTHHPHTAFRGRTWSVQALLLGKLCRLKANKSVGILSVIMEEIR